MPAEIRFQPMTSASAEVLGTAFAAIDPWVHYGYTAEALSTFLLSSEDGARHFEIIVDDEIAGAICIRKNWLRGPYLQFLGVVPGMQKRGAGSAALVWFEAQARKDRARNIWVVATEFNVGALTFYERFGFVRIATLDGLVSDGTAEILLRKRLINN
ncbi:MAG: GNAT family N-acetyltransferase [Hyphomicrobium sp.]|uniref:GNAT family N-acetyltransferase n=1 Tax=Hyphomicrobium sp. TaxID=82 RepID=UPI0039E6B5EC